MTADPKARVLLVDDHPANLVDLRAILQTPSIELVAVTSTADACRQLEVAPFAAIIVAAEMSVSELKANTRGAPILLLGGRSLDPVDMTKAFERGAVDVLYRSFGAELMRAKVGVFVELHQARTNLARADQLQQQFLATLGQELRAPLNTILGWIRMLRDGTLRESQRGRALETVENTATSQLELIQEMIDLSRMTSGTLALELGTVDLANTVAHVIERERPAALEKQLTLHAAIDEDIALMSGDQERLRQVVQRLLTNAVEGTPTEGLVTVSVRNVGPQVEVAITDTGPGFTAEALPTVFDRFVDDTLNARAGGALGLAIVRHLVELHGGTICAESAGPGLGSRFVVNLPAEGRLPRTDDEVR